MDGPIMRVLTVTVRPGKEVEYANYLATTMPRHFRAWGLLDWRITPPDATPASVVTVTTLWKDETALRAVIHDVGNIHYVDNIAPTLVESTKVHHFRSEQIVAVDATPGLVPWLGVGSTVPRSAMS